jgi:protein-L-isoaspartate O-methyltransferase
MTRDDTAAAQLIEAIKAQTWLTAPYTERQTLAAETLTALAAVPREEFVAAGDRAMAWENIPLGIGFGQTISQPFIVALMTAAVPVVPDQLTRQLKPGGRMVIPVGLPGAHQELMLLTRLASSRIKRESLLTVAFSLLVRPDEEHDLQQD